MEGFCLPLGVPDCEMCKMAPPFLEARTEAALGLGLCGAFVSLFQTACGHHWPVDDDQS